MKFKKTYSFAFWSASIISVFLIGLLVGLQLLFQKAINFNVIILAALISFIFSIVVIQIRVERFIYKRIKKIYEEVSLLDVYDLQKTTLTTNMETLSDEVKKFAEKKQIEIASLIERESYRREFLGNVSHELKTPLFTVQGYLLTLLDGAIDDEAISEKYLQRANKGVERLVAIVKDLDMISRLESNELGLEKETFNIVDLIQGVFDLLEMRSNTRRISLEFDKKYDVPVLVIGDKEKIEQVLINLIVNSLKYGKVGGNTTVQIENYGHQRILIKVTDNGEGIKKEHLSRLFERFYRVDQSRSREQGGSGLGLSIVKHIIEAHDETILVKSEYGMSSEFSFTLTKVK
ncbi:MAG: sensor histidine kinase [Urechidicola sp.]|nr:sensor histidine kinase [Urechidicola sp.]